MIELLAAVGFVALCLGAGVLLVRIGGWLYARTGETGWRWEPRPGCRCPLCAPARAELTQKPDTAARRGP